MHPLLSLALALVLMSGAACAQDRSSPSPSEALGAASEQTGAEATEGSGSSTLAPPATLESQGFGLDTIQGQPAAAPRGTGPGQDCTKEEPAASADCAPGRTGATGR